MATEKKDLKEPAKFDFRIEIKKGANGFWQAEKVFPEPRKSIEDFETRAVAIIAMESVAADKAREGQDVVEIVIYDERNQPSIRYRYKSEVIKHVKLLQG